MPQNLEKALLLMILTPLKQRPPVHSETYVPINLAAKLHMRKVLLGYQ